MSTTANRTNSLAYSFQETLTAILRVRYQRQQVQDSETFRSHIRRSLQTAMQDSRSQGYTSDAVQMGVLASVAYLDESILNMQSPVFADWARRPLQEELFGGHLAGETFFRNLRDLLNRQDSMEVADLLELYCLCLLLGYRGRYGLGDSGELHQLQRQARSKIARIRGNSSFLSAGPQPEVRQSKGPDKWSRRLLISAIVLAVVTLCAFAGFELALGSGASVVQSASINLR